jgi:hypothetical protein
MKERTRIVVVGAWGVATVIGPAPTEKHIPSVERKETDGTYFAGVFSHPRMPLVHRSLSSLASLIGWCRANVNV